MLNPVDLYDALDALSHFSRDASSNPIVLGLGHKVHALETINNEPFESRTVTLTEYIRQRHLRPSQAEQGYNSSTAVIALTKLSENGVDIPAAVLSTLEGFNHAQ
jgi:hypothetical protein